MNDERAAGDGRAPEADTPNSTGSTAQNMTKAQRRDWRRFVFGCGELTVAQRLTLLALEGFADYPAGTNARPGVKQLADICALKPRAVEYALARGRELNLIKQTGRANPVRGYAAVYRLLPVPDSTRTDMRVADGFNPHETTIQPARNGDSTRTSVQPTNPLPPNKNTEREAQLPTDANANESNLPPFCPDHMPHGTSEKCGPCGTARIARERDQKRIEAAAKEIARRAAAADDARIAAQKNCKLCGGDGFELGDDGTPLEPARSCPNCRPDRTFQEAAS